MKPYYYVYRYQKQAPKVRHISLAEAQAEAERLAAKNPGITFEILKTVGISQVIKPARTFWMDGENPPSTNF
jgi:hypothetical protein